jgi:hypothetical protein
MTVKPIVVATDGSEESLRHRDRVLAAAAERATRISPDLQGLTRSPRPWRPSAP